MVDLFYPEAGLDAIHLLEREGLTVHYPQGQTCCGQPAYTTGYTDEARKVARAQLELFANDWPVVVPSGSCAGMLRHHYLELFKDEPATLKQAQALAELGHTVDIATRRSAPDQADATDLGGGVRLLHLPGGPAEDLAKSAIDAHIEEFSAALGRLEPYDLVQSHHWMSGVAALPVARAWGVAHVQSYHSVAAHPGRPLSLIHI